jgi:tRNA(Ile)-lysidine synthase TilS/MesJ
VTKQSHKKRSESMKRCTICVLPETFPGIRFNDEGVCNHCQNFKSEKNLRKKKARYRKKFEGLIKEYRGQRTYDALLSYSGGKDSTYALSLIKKRYGLNVVAVTFDNGFLPQQTLKNIKEVTDKLSVDHVLFKPRFDILKRVFSACSKQNIFSQTTLIRASTICTACMAIVKSSSLRTALEKDIPFIIFGWSPGQIPISSSILQNNSQIVRVMRKSLYNPLYELVGDEINPYFLEEKHFSRSYNFPYNISPLAFLDYDEKEIIEKINTLGWKRPGGIDANSTNCLLNSYANLVHKGQYGYHPYAFEMAKLVREGYLHRSLALKKLDEPGDLKTIRYVKNILGQ